MELANCFGKVLRQLRTQAQLTQEQLGFESGLERNFISMLELGQRQPSLLTVFKLSPALGVLPESFVQLISSELQAHQQRVISKLPLD